MPRIVLSSLTCLAVVTAASLTVYAYNDIHIPGTACRPLKADVNRISYNNGSAANESTSTATVVCPVQYLYETDTTHPTRIEVRVIDRHPSSNFSCTFFAAHPFVINSANPINVLPLSSSSGSGGGVQVLSRSLNSSQLSGRIFSITCTVPAVSGSSQSELLDYRLFQVL